MILKHLIQVYFIATGFPHQENIIHALRENKCKGIAVGLGGVLTCYLEKENSTNFCQKNKYGVVI